MRIRLAPDVQAPAAARRFVRSALGEPEGTTPADDVVLVASELVTNSVRAGATGIEVELVVHDDTVELTVSDDAPGWPTVHHADLEAVDGRGLEIVGLVADAWHTTPLAEGKQVTATWSR